MIDKTAKILCSGLIFLLVVTIVSMFAQTGEEYQSRRKAVIAKMEPSSVMILRSSGSFSTFHTERQDGNFYYLTGINEPEAYLVLHSQPKKTDRPEDMRCRQAMSSREILFVTPQDPNQADWDAMPLGIKGAEEKLGFQDVRPSTEFPAYIDSILLGRFKVIYFDYQRSDHLMDPLTEDEQILKKRVIREPLSPCCPLTRFLLVWGKSGQNLKSA